MLTEPTLHAATSGPPEAALHQKLDLLLNKVAALENKVATYEAMLVQLPGMAAMAMDTMDDLYSTARQHGVDIEGMARSGLGAARALMESGVVDPAALQVIGSAGYALVNSQKEAKPIGLFGLLGAVNDADIQRALGFLVTFARHFGKKLAK